MSTASDPTIDRLVGELYQVEGKAEIVGGRIEILSSTGDLPSSAPFEIAASLRDYARRVGGQAYPDNVAFVVHLPHRKTARACLSRGHANRTHHLPSQRDVRSGARRAGLEVRGE